ncbi:DUF1415 domain-containing protein [Solimonas sp. K1W22B-7]|uniref:DUF1415 domain-containing protein n=1 Tax=Solimonas sp. K1W22B-7 TaxID=2303331 RepID=UPI000E33194A|nr:DUF1415 domain-containing protein [Solimonas sp. K1W22B-7]AXQ28878.1 DUF1415 domain-containing protein [Solimonas sp. K1W22B-7]
MNEIEAAVRRWLDEVVIGLNLCPFAARPALAGGVRVFVSAATTDLDLLTDLQLELTRLDETPPAQLETTLIAVPEMLADFLDYNDFLDQADALLERFEWDGIYQVASFHPQYQFAGTEPDDAENLTNRAPWPLLHLLREDSVEAAIASHPDVDGIPEANIRRMRGLAPEQRRRLFGV